MQAEEHLGSACESTAGLCPKHIHSISPAKCQESPRNPHVSLRSWQRPLRLCRGSFTSALTLSPASNSANLPLPLPKAPSIPACSQRLRGCPGGPVLQQEIFLSASSGQPPQPSCRPPAWSWGQFNQPSFPKLSQPARAIVTAGKNRQAPFSPALWGAPIHLFKQISKRAAALSSPLSSPGLTMG